MKNPELNTFLSKMGFTWRPAYVVYKDNDTYLNSVKENQNQTIYTFTANLRNSKVFEDFNDAYSYVCIYNNSTWAIDTAIKPENDTNTYRLFVMAVEIRGDKDIRTLKHDPIIEL